MIEAMVEPRTALLVLVPLAAAAGFGAGLLGGAVAFAGRTPPTESEATDLGPLLVELRALRADLRAEPRTIGGVVPSGGVERTEREPPSRSAVEPDRLVATVAELTRAVEALALRAEVLSARQMSGSGFLQTSAAQVRRDHRAVLAVRDLVSGDHAAAQAEWMFVTVGDLLRRLGRPSNIAAGKGGLQWAYEGEVDGDSYWVGFTIADGVVVRVD